MIYLACISNILIGLLVILAIVFSKIYEPVEEQYAAASYYVLKYSNIFVYISVFVLIKSSLVLFFNKRIEQIKLISLILFIDAILVILFVLIRVYGSIKAPRYYLMDGYQILDYEELYPIEIINFILIILTIAFFLNQILSAILLFANFFKNFNFRFRLGKKYGDYDEDILDN